MAKKILFITLISLSILVIGCSNKKVTTGTNNTRSTAAVYQPKDTTTATPETSKTVTTPATKNQNIVNKAITQTDALNAIRKILGTLPKGYHLDYDHMQSVDNKDYYVIHLYEVVVDNAVTGDSHSVTYEWYYVDKISGTIYMLDISTNALIKVNEKSTNPLQEQQVSYKQYANARFGFSIQYPSTFVTKLLPDNNDGIILASTDGSAELTISGINNVLSETAISSYNDLVKDHSNASYKNQKDNWFVVSWIDGDKIVYEKGVVGKDSTNTFIMKYPLAQKASYDSIISHLNSTFITPSVGTTH